MYENNSYLSDYWYLQEFTHKKHTISGLHTWSWKTVAYFSVVL